MAIINGTADADNLSGGDDGDLISGEGGDDTLFGGKGDDTLVGGAGDDHLIGNEGTNTAQFSGNLADYQISFIPDLNGFFVEDTVEGRDGKDTLTSIAFLQFADVTVSTADYLPPPGVVTGTSGPDTLSGSDADDLISGLGGDDVLFGGKGDDTLVGGAGNDELVGGEGFNTAQLTGNLADYEISFSFISSGFIVQDKVRGRDGTDILRQVDLLAFADTTVSTIDYAAAFVVGTDQNDTLVGMAASNQMLGLAGDDSMTGGTGSDALSGSEGNDTLDGGAGDDVLDGGEGDDVMRGGTGDDVFQISGQGTDVISGGAGTDSVFYFGTLFLETLTVDLSVTKAQNTGGAGIETLTGIENLAGSDEEDVFIGNNAANVLVGGGGHDILDGGAGSDQLFGGKGDDTYFVDGAPDQVTEDTAGGFDTVNASVSWTLGENVEDLNLIGRHAIDGIGNSLNNAITGNAANNDLVGADGDDLLDGREGPDLLTGGAGSDVFRFSTALDRKNVDQITDFNGGQDLIQLDQDIFYTLPQGVLDSAAFQASAVSTAMDASVRIIFNTATGALLFDPDGAGGTAAVQFATLLLTGIAGELGAGDIVVV
jgi:serralysin